MRKSWKRIVAAGIVGLGLMATDVRANAIAQFSVTLTTNVGGMSGGWKVFETNIYDANTDGPSGFTTSNPSSGLNAFQVLVGSTGGVTISTAGLIQIPTATDYMIGSTGFSVLRTASLSGGVSTIHASQASTYSTNNPQDVFSIYSGVGNVAETVNTADDGSGDPGPGSISTKNLANPVLLAQGSWTQNGSGGTVIASSTTTTIALLPNVMPTAVVVGQGTAPNVATSSPDSIVNGSAGVAAVPEPASFGIMAVGGLLTLARRRTPKKA